MIYYLVIPFNHKKKLKVRLKISEELDSSNVVTYLVVRLKYKGLKAYLVHTRPEGPPKDAKPSGKNMLWCPYCRDWRKFVSARYGPDWKICEICGISTRDFDVRKFNNLWEEVSLLHIKSKRGERNDHHSRGNGRHR